MDEFKIQTQSKYSCFPIVRLLLVKMTAFSIHLPLHDSLWEFLTNKTWQETKGYWEVALTDLYYPLHTKIQNVLDLGNFKKLSSSLLPSLGETIIFNRQANRITKITGAKVNHYPSKCFWDTLYKRVHTNLVIWFYYKKTTFQIVCNPKEPKIQSKDMPTRCFCSTTNIDGESRWY